MMQSFWGEHPGLGGRLDQLAAALDRMSEESKRKYGRGLDLAVLPETCVSGEAGGDALARSFPWDGPIGRTFSRAAAQHRCYIIVSSYLREAHDPRLCSNAAVLVGRDGSLGGIYRKVHLVPSPDGRGFQGGATPGREFPVFDCGFGKLGIQIGYDMEFDQGWRELARKGAELIRISLLRGRGSGHLLVERSQLAHTPDGRLAGSARSARRAGARPRTVPPGRRRRILRRSDATTPRERRRANHEAPGGRRGGTLRHQAKPNEGLPLEAPSTQNFRGGSYVLLSGTCWQAGSCGRFAVAGSRLPGP
jgi:hypothetical protein